MNRTLAIVVTLLLLPGAFALNEAVSFALTNRNNGSIVSSGVEREYLLYVPRNYDASKPTPLVLSMHGAGGWPAQQMETSRWNALADREGFIVVYPSGRERGGPRIWHVERSAELMDDVRFISDLIDELEATYNIDPRRIYANGLSNGAGMSFALSCTLSDRIAAVGLVSSALTLPFQWCAETRAVPMIAFHGTEDPVTPYNGGESWVSPSGRFFPNVPLWVGKWAGRNGCASKPVDSAAAADVTRHRYRCPSGGEVVFYTLRGAGHTWPGGDALPEWLLGNVNRNLDATSEMWAFFQAHPLAPSGVESPRADARHLVIRSELR